MFSQGFLKKFQLTLKVVRDCASMYISHQGIDKKYNHDYALAKV